jgi:hypothetical protein
MWEGRNRSRRRRRRRLREKKSRSEDKVARRSDSIRISRLTSTRVAECVRAHSPTRFVKELQIEAPKHQGRARGGDQFGDRCINIQLIISLIFLKFSVLRQCTHIR